MRWGRNKSTPLSSSSSSSSSPLLDRIFPLSWFSKSKKKKVDGGSDQTKNIQTEFLKIPTGGRRFNYSMDEDDFFWRLSFGGFHHHNHHKIIHGRKSTGGINPLWSNDTEEERKNFNDMVSDIRKLRRGKQTVDEVVPPHSRTRNGKHRKTMSAFEQMELQDFQVRSKPQEFKIAGAKKKEEEKVLEGMDSRTISTAFDSFAVVKSSYNPQKDFRQSMMEMIRERGIENAEDLEELLTCYLTLNCDEYHELIIKVFRQVWFDLNGAYHHYDRFN